MVERVARSTRVAIAVLLASPMIRSPSQCPGTARFATSAGRSLIMIIGSMNRCVRESGERCGLRRDLADTVKAFIDKPAVAILERVRHRRVTGSAGRWSYRLLNLRQPGEPAPELEPLPLD